MTETSTDRTDQRPLPLDVVEGLVGAVPKLIQRTRQQAALARSLAGMAPCLGFLAPRTDEAPAGAPQPEQVDVLTVLGDAVPDLTLVQDPTDEPAADAIAPAAEAGAPAAGAADAGAADAPAVATATPAAPTEDELPVQDYDSLAASQVVPRLAMLDTDELLAVQAYERAHRNRQTILNRVAQLLAG